ncbi:MAG: YggS family pyridoxal phosphate-dependent enzyme [Gammaproteobacteria bacterium]|nr:YggS family pyridoxal phosphate-dependent enzyme [Gammaproteobacteria bacterium]
MDQHLIEQRLADVLQRIAQAEQRFGRVKGSVQLVAVSKTRAAEDIAAAYAAGQTRFGENYLQEALVKQHTLRDLPLEWHFIGPLQSNKTRDVAAHFAWVHSLDTLKHAQRLDAQRPAHLPPLQVCIQVNISNEDSKSGVSVTELPALAQAVAGLPRLTLRGLMAIPAASYEFDMQRAAFGQLRALWSQLRAQGLALDTLSMGMSGDLEAAIAEGATLVRVGTDIFGARG